MTKIMPVAHIMKFRIKIKFPNLATVFAQFFTKSFWTNIQFIHPLKIIENQRFSDVFRGG